MNWLKSFVPSRLALVAVLVLTGLVLFGAPERSQGQGGEGADGTQVETSEPGEGYDDAAKEEIGRLTPDQRDERNREMVRTRVTFAYSLVFGLVCIYLLMSHLKNRRLRDEIEFLARRVAELEGKGDGR